MSVENSILITIRKMIGGDTESMDFDLDLIVCINSAISTLYQLGIKTVNPNTKDSFEVTGEEETWSDFLGDYKYLNMIKTYVYQKVRLIFDPPQNSFLVNAIQDQLKEIEWRIVVGVESDNNNDQNG